MGRVGFSGTGDVVVQRQDKEALTWLASPALPFAVAGGSRLESRIASLCGILMPASLRKHSSCEVCPTCYPPKPACWGGVLGFGENTGHACFFTFDFP